MKQKQMDNYRKYNSKQQKKIDENFFYQNNHNYNYHLYDQK